jgi:uncharacterized protein (DUF433 family)
MALTVLNINEIVSDPNVRGSRPVIAGTTITVMTIVLAHTTGDKLSLAQIAQDYRLSLGQVHAALAYYYLHQDEMDAQSQHDAAAAQMSIAELERQGKLIRHD